MTRSEHAATFRALHGKGKFLILANVWDAASARLTEEAGAPAIATSSAALAWANGYPDGNALPMDVHVRAVEAIARAIRVPLTVDSEGGYSDDPAQTGENIGRLIDAGAVGINLEDGTGAPNLLARKIEAVKAQAARQNIDLFVNARTDVVLHKLVPADEAVAESIRRAELYAGAGADGIFVPFLTDSNEIRQVAETVDPLPLNVVAWPGLGSMDELKRAGVRRLSAGARIGYCAFAEGYRRAASFLKTGSSPELIEGYKGATLPDLNDLLGRR